MSKKQSSFILEPQYDTRTNSVSGSFRKRTDVSARTVIKRMSKIIEEGRKVREEYCSSNVVSSRS